MLFWLGLALALARCGGRCVGHRSRACSATKSLAEATAHVDLIFRALVRCRIAQRACKILGKYRDGIEAMAVFRYTKIAGHVLRRTEEIEIHRSLADLRR